MAAGVSLDKIPTKEVLTTNDNLNLEVIHGKFALSYRTGLYSLKDFFLASTDLKTMMARLDEYNVWLDKRVNDELMNKEIMDNKFLPLSESKYYYKRLLTDEVMEEVCSKYTKFKYLSSTVDYCKEYGQKKATALANALANDASIVKSQAIRMDTHIQLANIHNEALVEAAGIILAAATGEGGDVTSGWEDRREYPSGGGGGGGENDYSDWDGDYSSDSSVSYSKDTTAPKISKSNYQFWYGAVNCWSCKVGGKYVFEAQIPKLKAIKCTGYHIEMYAWTGTAKSPNSLSNIRTAYQKLLGLCRNNKMWLFVDVINGNFNGSKTKWTAGLHHTPTVGQIVKSHGQGLIDIIKANGPANVVVQPIGEPGSKSQVSDCQKFQDMCCDQLKDFILVTETGRSNSSKMKKASKFSVQHVTNSLRSLDESDTLVKGKNDGSGDWSSTSCMIAVTDSGPAIQALASPERGSQQGWLDKWTSACSRASRLVNAVRFYKGKCGVFVYYAFKFKCMGTNGSTVDHELNKGTWNDIKSIVNPKY